MIETTYRGRRAFQMENDTLRVTLLQEGGHVAEILHKPTGVNPLWQPNWPSIEPSAYDPKVHSGYGGDAESKLLAGIMGHNVCVDLFGGPSEEEAAAGVTVHGEASVAPYSLVSSGEGAVHVSALMPMAQLKFERKVSLSGTTVRFEESVENLGSLDRPIAWTQHVTLGAPFLEHGRTLIELSATRSRTYEGEFGGLYAVGEDFHWPEAPGRGGETWDLRVFTDLPSSAGYTAQLMDPGEAGSRFRVVSPGAGVALEYRWQRADFPWCGMWLENRSRTQPPWNGETVALGLEFGVSPMPESRRQMITRGSLFGVPGFRWVPARQRVTVRYEASVEAVGK